MTDINGHTHDYGVVLIVREKVGHARQAQAVAQATGLPFQIVAHTDLETAGSVGRPPFLIAAGRQSIAVARRHSLKSGCVSCVLQPVLWRPGDFDIIWSPEHDRNSGTWPFKPPAVRLFTLTAPSLIEHVSRQTWSVPDHIPSPCVAVLVGGPTRIHRMRADEVDELSTRLRAFALAHEVSLLIATSRRTPEGAARRLSEALQNVPHVLSDAHAVRDPALCDPVPKFLSMAQAVVVTNDSVAMLSEAAAFGVPIYGWRLPSGRSKFDRFHEGLISHGAMRWFDGSFERWSYPPLNPAHDIASAIRQCMGLPVAP